MPVPCRTCTHPDRERIEQELAVSRSVAAVAERWGMKRRALSRHRSEHMTQTDIARLRHGIPEEIDVDIDEMTRRGGQDAMIGLKRLNQELQAIAEKCDEAGSYDAGLRARDMQFKVYREQMRLAAMYPGLKQTVNNNLFVTDGESIFRLVERILSTAPNVQDAKRLIAAEYQALALAGNVIEGELA